MKRRPHLFCHASVLLLFLVAASWRAASAQAAFTRNDAFDFREPHVLRFIGTGGVPSAFGIALDDSSDWNGISIAVKLSDVRFDWYNGQEQMEAWPTKARFDWTGTGSVFTDSVLSTAPGTVSHYYSTPGPHSVLVEFTLSCRYFALEGGWQYSQATCVRSLDVVTLPGLPVFATPDSNAVIQLRNEVCTDRVPILIVEGIDLTNSTSIQTYYAATSALIDTLYSRGCEVFFLNFRDATRDMSENALVVMSALEVVHGQCPDFDVTLVGMSMGGVVCRYALAKAEQQQVEHHVGLFISYDAPQQGAHVSPDLQDLIKRQDSSNPAIALLQNTLQLPASRQLLRYNAYDPYTHNAFYAELNALNGDGYPHQSHNVAISNGSRRATWGYARLGNWLCELSIIFEQDTIPIQKVNSTELDLAAGSTQVDFARRQYGTLFSRDISVLGLFSYSITIGYEFAINFNPVYMATESALDLRLALHDDDGNIYFDAGSAFDDTLSQPPPDSVPRGLQHNALSAASVSKVLEWLDLPSECTVRYSFADAGGMSVDSAVVAVGTLVSVEPRTVTLGGRQITCVFGCWDDGSTENPRRLYRSRTVVMKAHLAGSASGATWANGQRRVAEGADYVGPTYHAVYESGGEIWQLRNRRRAGWEPERLMSVGAGGASQPSVACWYYVTNVPDQIQVYVAWRQGDGTLGYRESAWDNGTTWGAPITIAGLGDPSTPVVADKTCLVWSEGANCQGTPGIYYYKWPATNTSGTPLLVPGTGGNASAPAIGVHSNWEFRLAFARDGHVYVEGFHDPNPSDWYVAPTVSDALTDLTTAGWTAANPTLALGYGSDMFVAWEEWSESGHRIAVRQRSGGIWQAPVCFSDPTDVPTKPVLEIDYSLEKVRLLWQCGNRVVYTWRELSGSVWAPVHVLGTGKSPSIVSVAAHDASAMWVNGTDAPYAIQMSENCAALPPAAVGDLQCTMGRTTAAVMWTAPGEDSVWGVAEEYDLRYSRSPITLETFSAATRVTTGAPGEAGTVECASVSGLSGCRRYYFAIKTRDAAGNWSGLSNVPSGLTVCSGYVEVLCEGMDELAVQGDVGAGWQLESFMQTPLSPGEGQESSGHRCGTGMALSTSGALAVSPSWLAMPLATTDGRVSVRLSPGGGSAWQVEEVELGIVDHASGERLYVQGDAIVVGSLAEPRAVSTDAGTDLRAALCSGPWPVTAAPGSVWDVDLGGGGATDQTMLLGVVGTPADRAVSDSGIVVLIPGSGGAWARYGVLKPSMGATSLVVEGIPGDRVRLVFGSEQGVTRLALLRVRDRVSLQRLTLADARHSRLGSVLSALAMPSEPGIVLHSGENLVLGYQSPPLAAGQMREYYLVARGRRVSPESAMSPTVGEPGQEISALPVSFALHQNRPNPFRGSTSIRFDLPVPGRVRLELFDTQGRRVRTLADGFYVAGFQFVTWDQRDEAGSLMKPGVYLCRIRVDGFQAQRKMLLLP